MTVLVIDGNNIAHRCRHAYDLSCDGQDVSVLFGFLKMLDSLMGRYDPAAVVVCWDSGFPLLREQSYPGYKAHRNHNDDPTYPDFLAQVQELHATLPLMGIASVKRERCEADDLMYHAAMILSGDVVIVTSDHDLWQAVSSRVRVYSHTKDEEITPDSFEDITGVSRIGWFDYLVLVGDSGDGISGVPKVGHATALKLLNTGRSALQMVYAAESGELDGVVNKAVIRSLIEFGTEGMYRVMRATDLSEDIAGAGRALLDEFACWEDFHYKDVRAWMKRWRFISFGSEFYFRLKRLRNPGDLVDTDHIRVPNVPMTREPV